ncbi:MAG: M56 family metallopeptidase [Ginsengibacter sp.]
MSLFFSTGIITKELVQTISWTLIHSIWQGILLSLLAAAIILFTKRNSAALRYNLLAGGLLAFVIAVSATLFLQIQKTSEAGALTQIVKVSSTSPANTELPAASTGVSLSISNHVVGFLNVYSGWIVLAWMIITMFRCIRLSFGLYGLYRLKKVQSFAAGKYWSDRIEILRQQMNISKPVQLLQSGLAKVPSAIGYFSPVILFPCGMLNSMSAGEVEAILVHELAHIRRHDFVVNMLQNIIEIIFFFNPAVLWVSSLIKAERENCCDDIAVGHSCNKRLYINALMTFGELYRQPPHALANALGGNTNQLMYRIKRIIYNDNKTLNNMEKKFLAAGIILTCVFAFAFSSNVAQQNKDTSKAIQQNGNNVIKEKTIGTSIVMDTLPIVNEDAKETHNETIQTSVNGKEYKIVTQNGAIDELYIDGKKVPEEKTGDYKEVTDEIISQMQIDGKEAKEEMLRSQKEMSEAAEDQKTMAKEMKERAYEMEQAKKEMNENLEEQKRELENTKRDFERSQKEMAANTEMTREQMEQVQKEAALYNEKAKKEMELSQKDMAMQNEKARKEMEQSQKDMALYNEKARQEMEKSKQDMAAYKERAIKEAAQSRENMARNKEEMEKAKVRMEQSKKDMEQAKAIQKEIISDLIEEGIIQNESDLSSYKLSNDELIVNGTKQPDAIHKKFKEKYSTGKDRVLMYNYNIH